MILIWNNIYRKHVSNRNVPRFRWEESEIRLPQYFVRHWGREEKWSECRAKTRVASRDKDELGTWRDNDSDWRSILSHDSARTGNTVTHARSECSRESRRTLADRYSLGYSNDSRTQVGFLSCVKSKTGGMGKFKRVSHAVYAPTIMQNKTN